MIKLEVGTKLRVYGKDCTVKEGSGCKECIVEVNSNLCKSLICIDPFTYIGLEQHELQMMFFNVNNIVIMQILKQDPAFYKIDTYNIQSDRSLEIRDNLLFLRGDFKELDSKTIAYDAGTIEEANDRVQEIFEAFKEIGKTTYEDRLLTCIIC